MITYSFVFMLYHFSPWSFVRYPLTSIFRSWFGNRHLVMIYLSLSFVKVVANIDWNKACVEARSVPYIQPCSISCFFQILWVGLNIDKDSQISPREYPKNVQINHFYGKLNLHRLYCFLFTHIFSVQLDIEIVLGMTNHTPRSIF